MMPHHPTDYGSLPGTSLMQTHYDMMMQSNATLRYRRMSRVSVTNRRRCFQAQVVILILALAAVAALVRQVISTVARLSTT
jgi:hypothetical protein